MSKVLVIVPHEDDELAVAGSLLVSLNRIEKNETYVVFTTNGDAYPKDGPIRIKEAIDALRILGTASENIFFLGYGNEWRNGHIYHRTATERCLSRIGKEYTYGSNKVFDYAWKIKGKHHAYTRENYRNDLINVIENLLPEWIVAVDYDSHPDHRATSLLLDECMGIILKKNVFYHPNLWKKFAYLGVWEGIEDYYSHDVTKNQRTNNNTDNPVFLWSDAIRLKTDEECNTRLVRKNLIYKAACCHKSENAWRHITRICNADVLYWKRRTDNLLLYANIEVTSGNGECLNDFVITNTADVEKFEFIITEQQLWHPVDDDKRAIINFNKAVKATCIILYESPVYNDDIHKCMYYNK